MTQEIIGFWDAVASVGPYANNLHLAPDRITTPTPHNLIFTGQMLFLTPNQQCQSTELKLKIIIIVINLYSASIQSGTAI